MQKITWKTSAFFILLIGLSMSSLGANTEPASWVVYYNDEQQPAAFKPYQLIVVDSDHHPSVAPLLEMGKTVLAYISLGEVESYRHWYNEVKKEGILLQENENWPGSFFVDTRDNRWTKRVVEQLIPAILRKGFSGIFLDTLDNSAELERIDPKKYRGMTKASAALVRTIRRHYPEIKIMLNRGYEILPMVGDVIDMELGESVYTDYNFNTKVYSRAKKNAYESQVKVLQQAASKFPNIQIYTLDYWDENDKKGIAEIYATQRKKGFIPYVSTIDLKKIIPEP